MPFTNQQQLDCLLNHMEHSQNLNLWNKQTEKSSSGNNKMDRKTKRIQIVTPSSSPPPSLPFPLCSSSRETTDSSSIIRTQPSSSSTTSSSSSQKVAKGGHKLEWVVLPVFVDIVKLALKAREDCSIR